MTLPFDPEADRTLREYAATLTTRQLFMEIVGHIDRAIEINNSGCFHNASLFIMEFESRYDSEPDMRKALSAMRRLIDHAVSEAHVADIHRTAR